MRNLFAILAFATTLVILGCSCGCSVGINKYDTLVAKDEACNKAWADVETQLQRRHDLIPALVAVVKGHAAHEEKVFIEVAKARAGANGTCDDACRQDPARLKAFQDAQARVQESMISLVKLQETYPALGSDRSFTKLQTQIEGTENRITRARGIYNESVSSYNTELRRVSGQTLQIVIGSKTFVERPYYKADAGTSDAPTVSF